MDESYAEYDDSLEVDDAEFMDVDRDIEADPDPSTYIEEETNGEDAEADADVPNEMNTDDGDPIIKEIDVYFSQALADQLCLFQFPTRPHPFDDQTKPTVGRMKPNTKRFELEIPLQTRSPHYNKERGEELGQGTDNAPMRGVFDYDDSTPAKLLDKQTLSSSLLPSHANYMIGVIKDDEIHLTSIGTALQLRTSLYYIDKITEKQATRFEEDSLEANKRANPEYEEDAKVLSVTVKGPEDKDAIRKAAQVELQRKAEEEAWMPMSIYHADSEESHFIANSLLSANEVDVDFVTKTDSYLDEINPTISAMKLDDSNSQLKKGLTLNHIALLPLKDKLKALLMNANVAKFSTITNVIPGEEDEDEFLAGLREAAVLVRGTWIVRSELLYSGHALEARRWLLYMFQRSQYVSRREFAELVRIPGPMATSMLSEIAVLEPSGWTLKVTPDEVFVDKFEDIVMEQAAIVQREAEQASAAWEPRQPKLAAGPSRAARRTENAAGAKQAKARTAAKSNVVTQSISVKGTNMEEQLDFFIYDLLVMHNVSSVQYITQAAHTRATETDLPGNLLGPVTDEDVLNSLEETCIEIRDGLWVRKEVKHPPTDQYRPIVIELFKTKDIVAKKEANEAAKAAVGKEIPLGPYSKIMHELATVKSQGKWQLKQSP
ncbi:hypothetical protein PhCBS80983_g02994 [Powellomyces hirtus]|uniref:DNA-directed RNA polymerase III subunit RPC5 n=1 Tax=Powellomyces hirtus TaxID=109895 RepID=A0A507E463_9FUNG|nr:hypothetical protein PhCBS80983_g02994 [Powellomyces hirtus]